MTCCASVRTWVQIPEPLLKQSEPISKLDIYSRACNLSTPTGIWEMETGKPLKALEIASLVCAEEKKLWPRWKVDSHPMLAYDFDVSHGQSTDFGCGNFGTLSWKPQVCVINPHRRRCYQTSDVSAMISFIRFSLIKNSKEGWEDHSMGDGTCHHSWWLEFVPQDSQDRRRELTATDCPLASTMAPWHSASTHKHV